MTTIKVPRRIPTPPFPRKNTAVQFSSTGTSARRPHVQISYKVFYIPFTIHNKPTLCNFFNSKTWWILMHCRFFYLPPMCFLFIPVSVLTAKSCFLFLLKTSQTWNLNSRSNFTQINNKKMYWCQQKMAVRKYLAKLFGGYSVVFFPFKIKLVLTAAHYITCQINGQTCRYIQVPFQLSIWFIFSGHLHIIKYWQ